MKKVFMVLFLLLAPIINVSAKEKNYIDFDWSFKQGPSAQYLFFDETMEVEDGYVTQSLYSDGSGVIRKISKDGKEIIWEYSSGNNYPIGMTQYGGYYYMVFTNPQYRACIIKLNTNGEYVHAIYFENNTFDAEIYVYEKRIYVIGRQYGVDGSGRSAHVYTINPNGASMVLEDSRDFYDVPEENLGEITYNHQDQIIGNWNDSRPEGLDNIYVSNQYNDNEGNIYLVGDFCKSSTWRGFIAKLDKNKNLIWYKTANANTHYYDMAGISSGLITVAAYEDDTLLGRARNLDRVISTILVYDKDGNLLETHDLAEEMGVTKADISHVLPFNDCLTLQAWAYDENGVLSSYLIKYTTNYEIKKEASHGTVTISNLAKSGEEVELAITPDINYMIKDVIVTDLYGNVIPVTDNKFIMPSSNVTVKVTFTQIVNPKTGMNIIGIISLLTVIVGISIYSSKTLKKS